MARWYKIRQSGADNIVVLVKTEKGETPLGYVMTGTGKERATAKSIISEDIILHMMLTVRTEAAAKANLILLEEWP